MPLAADDANAIRNLNAALCYAIDDGNFDAWADCYACEGVVDASGQRLEGRAAIVAEGRHLRATTPAVATCRHVCSNLVVAPDGDGARGTSTFQWIDPLDGGRSVCVGIYRDVYRRTDGRWQIAERRVEILTPPDEFAANLERANERARRRK